MPRDEVIDIGKPPPNARLRGILGTLAVVAAFAAFILIFPLGLEPPAIDAVDNPGLEAPAVPFPKPDPAKKSAAAAPRAGAQKKSQVSAGVRLAQLQAVLDGPTRSAHYPALSAAFTEFAAESPARAMQLAELLTPDGWTHTARQVVFREWSKADPAAAAQWMLDHPDLTGPQGESTFGRLLSLGWRETDPLAAINWFEQNPGVPGAREGVQYALETWMERNPAAAFERANRLTDPRVRDAALEVVVASLAASNAESALRTAQEIADPAARTLAIQATIAATRKKDPAKADALVKATGISDR